MTQPAPAKIIAQPKPGGQAIRLLQRKCTCGGTPGPTGECENCRKKREAREAQLQRWAVNSEPVYSEPVNEVPPIVHQVLQSRGQPLDRETRAFMEPRFGRDFSQVRVHTDAKAAESAQAVNALAYTVGHHIAFAPHQYAPGSAAGQRLLAHELAHVVQQRGVGAGLQPFSIGPVSDPSEAEADWAARAVMAGQPTAIAQHSAPVLARLAETRTLRVADGSEVDVTRSVTPGRCALVPESRSRSSSGATASNAFLELNLCRGQVGGGARGQINYGGVLDGAKTAAGNLLRNLTSGQDAQQSLRGFGDEIKQLSPEAEVNLNLKVPGFRLNLSGLGRANLSGQASGRGTARAEIDLGPLTLTVEGGLEGGNDRQTSGDVLVSVRPRDRAQTVPNCFVCSCTPPQVDFSCARRPPPSQPQTPRPQPVIVPLFYEYALPEPRKDWQVEYQRMVQLAVSHIREGYKVERIIGNTSPEGPLVKQKGSRFEGNIALAQERAQRAHDDLYAAIRAALASPLLMRSEHLQAALDAEVRPEGKGELFGTSQGQEVGNRDLFGHLQTTLAPPQAGQSDPLAQQHVTGQDLPQEVRAQVESGVEQFRSGRAGEQKLSQAQRLEAIYRPLRRALIFLKAPSPPPISIHLTPQQVEQIVGRSIDCTDEHRKLFDNVDLPKGEMFQGECNQPGSRPDRGESP